MDNFDGHRGGDRYRNGGDEHLYHSSSVRKSRDGGGGRGSPHGNRGGFSGGGGGGWVVDGGERENQSAFDSPPPIYPQPLAGEGGVGVGGLRQVGDGIGGFRPMIGGPMVGGGGRGFRTMGGGGRGGFRPIASGDEFQRMGGGSIDGGDFQPTDNPGSDGGFQPMGRPGGNGLGFRPMGGSDGGRFDFDEYQEQPPGQKRGYPFSGRERSPPGREGTSFAKLFVGSVPRTATENDIRPLFENHGRVLEVALIKDKRTGLQQGCCFIKYATSEEADRAIRALHNQYTLPGAMGPIQVRYADGERERLGATEFKLFVGSLNRQATEKEVEEIFSPYGRVEDVYLMRDEMKQSRGCGFVKYSHRDMAHAAINALNGIYTMRGCDQPLTVRYADPKKPRTGDSRSGPFGGPAFAPRFSSPAFRPPLDHGEPLSGSIPSNWPPVNPQSLGPAQVRNQFPGRSGDMTVSSTPGPIGNLPGKADGSLPGPTRPTFHSPRNLPPPAQVQPSNSGSFSSPQSLQGPYMQPGQTQKPQQLSVQNSQYPVPLTQGQCNAPVGPGQVNQQLQPAQQCQSPSQLAQMLSQQTHNLQATFQSSQLTFNQLQQQVQQLQPSNQNSAAHQNPWSGTLSQPVANTSVVQPAGKITATTPAAATNSAIPTVSCNWTEHMSPDGYKYYYNSLTGESKWEKPEELTQYGQQQQPQKQKPSNQNPHIQASQIHLQPQGPYDQLQDRPKSLQQATQTSYQVTAFSATQGSKNKEHGYGQIPARTGQVTINPTRNQQGVQASQEWMWNSKN